MLDRLLADPRLPAPIEPAWAQPGRWHGRPTAASTVRADPVTLQRGPAPVRGPGRPTGRRSRPAAALVGLATPTSSPRPYLPRPTTGRLADREDHDLRLEYQPQHFMVAPCLRSGAGQWRRDPVTAPRALATLTRMARDDCAGEERKGEEWAVGLSRIVAGAAGYPLVSRPGVSSPGSRRPVTWPGAGLGVRGSDGGRNGPGTPGI